MTTADANGPKPAASPPAFLVGSRPSFMEIVASHSSLKKPHVAEEKEGQPGIGSPLREVNPLLGSTSQLERFAKWSIAATMVCIFCTAWIAWSIYELHDFALRQAKSVSDSIEVSRYAILAANRRAEATEKSYDLAAETSRS